MKKTVGRFARWGAALAFLALGAAIPAAAQVSPEEIRNPQLKPLESAYLQKLIALNREISGAHYPFPLVLSRVVGLDPKDQPQSDKRGIEFVLFHDRVVLKFSGNYNASFNGRMLKANQRADRVFEEVIVPILRMLPRYFAESKDIENIGFEFSYHVADPSSAYRFEGRENLVAVFAFADAMRYPGLSGDAERQALLNQSSIYLNGKVFRLALGKAAPLAEDEIESKAGIGEASGAAPGDSGSAASDKNPEARPAADAIPQHKTQPGLLITSPAHVQPSGSAPEAGTPAGGVLTKEQVEALQAKYQSQLDEFGKYLNAHFSGVEYAPPVLALFRNAAYLQLTVRNPHPFDPDKTSLYKRAALSFDTFLAPQMKDLLAKLPDIPEVAGLDISVLTKFTPAGASASSEAIEYVSPLSALRQFAAYEIPSQEMINQSLVIVNGVRISLVLQQAE